MSLTDVRAYFRARAKAVSLVEWLDGFNFDNIPANLIDNSFHLEMGVATGRKLTQTDLESEYPVVVRIFVKGYRDPASGIDRAILLSENLIKESLTVTNRATQTGIKNVFLDTLALDPIADSNDNLVVASVTFRALVIVKVDA